MNNGCEGFKVYPRRAFYIVRWDYRYWFFDTDFVEDALELSKDSISVHVWNSLRSNEKVEVTGEDDVAYGLIAGKHCPLVYNSVEKYF